MYMFHMGEEPDYWTKIQVLDFLISHNSSNLIQVIIEYCLHEHLNDLKTSREKVNKLIMNKKLCIVQF